MSPKQDNLNSQTSRLSEIDNRVVSAVYSLDLPVPDRDIRDPRFETLTGRLDESRFRKQYAFLYEEALPRERSGTRTALKVGFGLEIGFGHVLG